MTAGTERETGSGIVLKEWLRDPKVADDDLREIWRHEIRQLHRLAGYPGAREHIVLLHDSAEDSKAFYQALNSGQRAPLRTFLDSPHKEGWLHNPRRESSRLHLWRNLQRVAKGLDILHMQGLLHRNLDDWSVFTDAGDEPDFQLSGFEWSIRLAGGSDAPRIDHGRDDDTAIHSFLEDWKAFGQLAALLLNIDSRALLAHRPGLRNPAEFLDASERTLLLLLLRADPLKHIDGDLIDDRICTIVSNLERKVTAHGLKLYLTCSLGSGQRLSEKIRTVSEGSIEMGDTDRQLAFIREDLSSSPNLIIVADKNAETGRRYLLVGHDLIYKLRQYRPRGGNPTWDVAYCDRHEDELPLQPAIIGEKTLSSNSLELLPLPEAKRRFVRLQGKATRWERQIESPPQKSHLDERAERRYRGLVLVQLLESLRTAAEIWPISVIKRAREGERTLIHVKPRADSQIEGLSQALGLDSPAARFRETFESEQADGEYEWKLTEEGVLGEWDRETAQWSFVEVEEKEGAEPLYVFESVGEPPIDDSLFLRNSGFVGQDLLLKRQIKALRALREHVELLAMLTDPRIGLRPTHDDPAEDEAFANMDESKQCAIKELWGVLPAYFIQGPPGVGKTRLVRELVARRFAEDSTTRILLSAQSHQAVDHLSNEIHDVLTRTDGETPLSIRCFAKNRDGRPGPFDLREQARSIIDRLMKSKLAADAPDNLLAKLEDLRNTFGNGQEEEGEFEAERPDRAFEAMLLRSANVVLASTNAGDLERLIEEHALFDWTIVEEAGKASGVELLSPLLLSHRRLMIGDHLQLPPFEADQRTRLLNDPSKIRDALTLGRNLVGRLFPAAEMDELISSIEGENALAAACGEAADALMMFETMVRKELDGRISSGPRLPIATRLSRQHRMHPAIARLISQSFYDGSLSTDRSCERKYQEESAPFSIADNSRLPDSPVVFIDMPYVQSTMGKRDVERQPRYHNPEEAEAVTTALSLIQAKPVESGVPSLAVLSPYREQVRRLEERIDELRPDRLAHLSGFSIEGKQGIHIGTVDSFQGSEADVVLVSLVRNNHHSGRRGLGFLGDARRMNVLLSRAKWKLILVGSLEFLQKRFQSGSTVSSSDLLAFLKNILDTMDELRLENDEKGEPLAAIVPVSTLMGEAS